MIEDILSCRLALLRYQFTLVLLQISVHLIEEMDREEDEIALRERNGDQLSEEQLEALAKNSPKEIYRKFTNLVVPLYLQLILDGKAGPKEENLILGLLCNLSRNENGQLRLMQQKQEDDLDDDELDEDLNEDLDEDAEGGSCGRFVPWLFKKVLSYSQEELEGTQSDNAGEQPSEPVQPSDEDTSANELDTYTRCIQLLVNVTRTEDGRNYILMKDQEPVLKRIISSINHGPVLRRKGSVAVVRNCLLVREQHAIVGSFYFVEPFLERLEKKVEQDNGIRRDIAECIYALSLGDQVIKVAPHKDRIMQIHDEILINTPEKRLLKLSADLVEGRTEAVKEGDYIRFDESTGSFSKVNKA